MKKKERNKANVYDRMQALCSGWSCCCCCSSKQCNKKEATKSQHKHRQRYFKRLSEKAKAEKQNEKREPHHSLYLYTILHTYIYFTLFVYSLHRTHTNTHWLKHTHLSARRSHNITTKQYDSISYFLELFFSLAFNSFRLHSDCNPHIIIYTFEDQNIQMK